MSANYYLGVKTQLNAKRVAINVWPSEAVCVWEFPLVFNMCVWVQGFFGDGLVSFTHQ